jgi:urea carboxylase-associated protein 2
MTEDPTTTSATASPRAAREHARRLEGASARYRPTVPASAASFAPDGIDAEQMLWAETVGPGGYAVRRLPLGAVVRLTDVDGDACANVLVFNALRPVERLNVADTVKVQWQAYLGTGALLLSDMGRALMSIGSDTSGVHDALCGASNERRNRAKYGTGSSHGPCPNARDRFAVGIAKFGLARRDIVPSVALFKGAQVATDGTLTFVPGAGAGAYVELRAEVPVLFAVANTPHPLDPRTEYVATALRIAAWQSRPTTRADDLWASTPEVERAFLNTEQFLQEFGDWQESG